MVFCARRYFIVGTESLVSNPKGTASREFNLNGLAALSPADSKKREEIPVKAKEGQRWDYRIESDKLKFRQRKKRSTTIRLGNARLGDAGDFGRWRKIKKDTGYEIREGSGLPHNLFQDLQQCTLDPVMKITPEQRTFRRVLKALRRDLADAAKVFGCDLHKESKTQFQLLQEDKPSMEFRIVDFHYNAEEFFQRDKNGDIIKNKKGKRELPRRDLGRLTEQLRKRKRFEIQKWEQASPAKLRWLIVVFAPSLYADRNVWLVPAKSQHRYPR
jgi:hypothetical protein